MSSDLSRTIIFRFTILWMTCLCVVLACCGCGPGSHVAEPLDEEALKQGKPDTDSDAKIEMKPFAAVDSVRHTKSSAGHRRMLSLLQQVLEDSDDNVYLGTAEARKLRKIAGTLTASTPAENRWNLFFSLGNAELKLGNERDAIAALEKAHAMNLKSVPSRGRDALTFNLAVAYMRLAETENCCQRNTPDSCILPLRGGGIHTNREGSTKAISHFVALLRRTNPRSFLHLKSRWLLNVAYMTLGEYPTGVPSQYLIPDSMLASDETIPRFVNVAKELGVDTFSNCGGAIVDDFNGDALLDLAVSTFSPSGQLRIFANRGDGRFLERTSQAGLNGLFGGLNMIQADYDNDGDTDILVLRGAWLAEQGQHPNSLLQNQGDGSFVDVTFDAGLAEVHYPTQTAAWADYDNDGDLDLYIGNESTKQLIAPNQLFRNQGDGSFLDVAADAGVTNLRFTKAVVWGDFDDDRWPDIYVSNNREDNRLYRNLGDGTFQDVAVELEVTKPRASFPAWFWDFDNDGILDIYVADYSGNIAYLAADYLGRTGKTEWACLYRGDGRGFQEVSQSVGLTKTSFTMGANFGDLDNDGFLDFYLGTGDFNYEELAPNVMYLNRQGQRFDDVTMVGGFGHLQKGHAVVFADLDHDGDQDVFEQLGGALRGDKYHDALFENPGFDNRWIAVKLKGVKSNRSAIGARIRVDVEIAGRRQSFFRHVNSGGSFGANPLRQTIGLGQATKIHQLEIYWPTTDETQRFERVSMDQFIEVVEGKDQIKTYSLQPFPLGGAKPSKRERTPTVD